MQKAKPTDLTVFPKEWEMGHADRQPFSFDAEEAIDGATAELIRLDTMQAAGTIGTPDLSGTVATVTVGGLSRGVTYELAVTFTAAGGARSWTRTLAIPCVA